MANKITAITIITNRRLNSIETQMYTFLGDKVMPAKEVKSAFDGIASQNTINQVAKHSSFLKFSNGEIEILDVDHKADIEYDFSYPAGESNIGLQIGNKKGKVGTGQKLIDISLKGFFHSINVHVQKNGTGNWKLSINKIRVKTDIVPYERVIIAEQPIKKNGDYETRKK